MPWGLHKYLPQQTAYITMLRDPIDRIISHYYFVISKPNHYLHNKVISKKMDLENYVSSGISPELNNGQVRMITSVWGNDPVSSDTLEQAKVNLNDHFLVVGLVERFDESLVLFSKLLGWKNIYYVKRNVTYHRPVRQQVCSTTLRVIERYNRFDMELYEFAKQIFQEKLKQVVPRKKLIIFQFLNSIYQSAYPFLLTPLGCNVKTTLFRLMG